jgi:hypothetical protein
MDETTKKQMEKMKLKMLEKFQFQTINLELEAHVQERAETKDSRKDFPDVLVFEEKGEMEFGIETDNGKVVINAGGIGIKLSKEDYLKAHFNWIARGKIQGELNAINNKKVD